ncbi:hypothetical protein ACWF95_10850 [Streptomyces vinaceus]
MTTRPRAAAVVVPEAWGPVVGAPGYAIGPDGAGVWAAAGVCAGKAWPGWGGCGDGRGYGTGAGP